MKKWNRSFTTESNIFCKCIIPIIRKEYALLLLTTALMKNGEEKVIFLWIIHCNKKKCFKWLFPQWSSYSLCIKLCLLNINNISKGHIGSLGERCSILDLLFWERGVAKFKLPYNYTKMISLQNVIGKIINDIITLFLFNILKLLCSNCFVHLSYFPTSTSVLNGFGASHLRATVYEYT